MAKCLCGCGEATGGTWVPGHDQKALWKIVEMKYGFKTTEELVAHHGYGTATGSRNLNQDYQAFKQHDRDRDEEH